MRRRDDGFVDEVDGLVGQEAVGDVAVRQRRRRDDRRVGDAHAVVQLVFFLQAAQDRDRVLDRRLVDEDRLEAPGQRRVLLDMLAIFVERGRADAVQLAARQRGLQQIGRVHRAIRLAGADQRVHLVDEQDDLALGGGDLIEHGLQPLLELAAIFRAGDERAHVERQQLLVFEPLRHVAIDDAQRETLDDRRLADAGLADQHRIVLRAARQHLDGAADFLVAADDRVELALARRFGEVAGVFLQRVILVFGGGRVGGAALAQILDGGVERLRRHARGSEDLARPPCPSPGPAPAAGARP